MKLSTLMTSVALAALASPAMITGAVAADVQAPGAGGAVNSVSVDSNGVDAGAADTSAAVQAPGAGGATVEFDATDSDDDEDVGDEVAEFGDDVGDTAEDVGEDIGEAANDVADEVDDVFD